MGGRGPERSPVLQLDGSETVVCIAPGTTTVGRGEHVGVRLNHPTVSIVHATLERLGRYVIVADLGLSANGTRVNGRPVGRRLLNEGDVICFGAVRCVARGVGSTAGPVRPVAGTPELTVRERDVLRALCRPAASELPFLALPSTAQIGAQLHVTDAAVKHLLLRLYRKFGVPEGPDRRARLANRAIMSGLMRPGLPPGG